MHNTICIAWIMQGSEVVTIDWWVSCHWPSVVYSSTLNCPYKPSDTPWVSHTRLQGIFIVYFCCVWSEETTRWPISQYSWRKNPTNLVWFTYGVFDALGRITINCPNRYSKCLLYSDYIQYTLFFKKCDDFVCVRSTYSVMTILLRK